MAARRSGFSRLDLMILVAVFVLVAALAVPGVRRGRRSSNEHHATAGLQSIVSAEADFKANDRDGNGVQDYWVADVSGLGDAVPRLIELETAGADSAPSQTRLKPAPRSGYWSYALVRDLSVTPAQAYARDTGGSRPMGAVHNRDRFGFLAYPDRFGETGRKIFIVNEAGTVWSREPDGAVKSTEELPPGAPLASCRNWPDDAARRKAWRTE